MREDRMTTMWGGIKSTINDLRDPMDDHMDFFLLAAVVVVVAAVVIGASRSEDADHTPYATKTKAVNAACAHHHGVQRLESYDTIAVCVDGAARKVDW